MTAAAGGQGGRVEMLTGIEGASSRPEHKIVPRTGLVRLIPTLVDSDSSIPLSWPGVARP